MAGLVVKRFPLQWPDGWPVTRAGFHDRGAPFQVTRAKTLVDLAETFRLLKVDDWLVSSNIPTRLDGLPRADGGPSAGASPGVAVYFVHKGAVRVMARDKFADPWANLRSVGLAVEALRALERHGGRLIMERAFAGFAALPAPASDWRAVLGLRGLTGGQEYQREVISMKYRDLAKGAAGDEAQLLKLNLARDAALAEIGGGS